MIDQPRNGNVDGLDVPAKYSQLLERLLAAHPEPDQSAYVEGRWLSALLGARRRMRRDELVEMEYVVRRPDPTDGRAKLIVLTDKGQECVSAGIATITTLEEGITALLGERGHRELRRLLQRLLDEG